MCKGRSSLGGVGVDVGVDVDDVGVLVLVVLSGMREDLLPPLLVERRRMMVRMTTCWLEKGRGVGLGLYAGL